MKKGTRLYINITNYCNTNCPFCCMYSGTKKNTYMGFETFKTIINNCKDNFELQLEGGESTISPILTDVLKLVDKYNFRKRKK